MRPPFSRTMLDLIEEKALGAPERLLALTAGGSVTYAQMAVRARTLAARLQADGIGRGSRVGLLSGNRIEWLEVFFAASGLGATVVPFSTWSTPAELEFLFADSRIATLFMAARAGDRDFAADIAAMQASGALAAHVRVVQLEGAPRSGWHAYGDDAAARAPVTLTPGAGASARDPLVILYTSGSSNRPKAVPLDQFAVIENGFNIGERQGLRDGDRVLVSIPLFWSYGVANALPATLTHGATLVLQERFQAEGALDLIERHACTAIYTLPAMTSALVGHPAFAKERTRSLRTGVTIGSPQDVIKAAQELGAREICNIYGSTETYGNCCVTPHDWPLAERSVTQGPPLPGVSLRIRDGDTGELLPAGEIGQLEVTGYLTRGYAGDSARHNAEVFTSDGWFRTGDLGAVTADGRFVYAGRSSEMIKRSGINVSPAEVEEVLQQHPHVGLAGVTGLPDAVKGEIIVAFVIPRAAAKVETSLLLEHCKAKLSRYKIPDRVEVCEALPLTATGKLMRRELKAIAAKIKG